MNTIQNSAKFRVLWIPQVPMTPFYVPVETKEQGDWLCGVLGDYDLFQYENNVKPDYSNAGGVQFKHDRFTEGEWWDIPEPDEWEDICQEMSK